MRKLSSYSIPASEHVPILVPVPDVAFLGVPTSKGKNGTLIGSLYCPSVNTIYLEIDWWYRAE